MEPSIETIRLPQAAEVAPGSNERLLDGIFRGIAIAQDQPGCRIQPGDRSGGQSGKGVVIAAPRPLHEISLHRALGP